MSLNLILRIVRASWIPFFIIGCAALIIHRAGNELSGFVAPQLHRPQYIAFALLAQCSVWILLAMGWQRLVKNADTSQLRLDAAFWHLALFSVGKYLPGKVWGFLARGSSMSREGIKTSTSIGASIIEQLIVFHSGFIALAAASIALLPIYLWAALMLIAIFSVFATPQLYAIAIKASSWALANSLKLSRPDPEARVIWQPTVKVVWFYVLVWLAHGAILFCLFLLTTQSEGYFSGQMIALFLLASTVGMLAGFIAVFAPAGFGVREAGMALILSTSIDMNDAILLAALMRIWSISSDLLLLLLVLGKRHINVKAR